MDINKILTADFLDILFEGKNKAYGAYELRKTYDKRLRNGLLGMLLVTVVLSVGAIVSNSIKDDKVEVIAVDLSLENVNQDEKKPEPPPPPPPPKQEPPKVEVTKFTPPKIVKDEEVKEEDEIKEVEKLEETKISTFNQEGTKDDGLVAPVEQSTGAVAAPKEEDYDALFTSVQIQAEFPGGQSGWARYLERTLNRDLPVENGAPTGKYSVVVSFIVSKDGSISDVKAENDPGYGTKEEAVRVIQRGPKWKPAVQNGRNVIYRQRQAIVFMVSED
jgi:protein TonB